MATYQKLPSGNYRAQVRLKGLRNTSKTFTLKRDAIAWATQIEAQSKSLIIDGFKPVPNGYTLENLITSHLTDTKPEGRISQCNGLANICPTKFVVAFIVVDCLCFQSFTY